MTPPEQELAVGPSARRAAAFVVLVRLALLIAIAGSAIMVVEYSGGETFCSAGSGCGLVRTHEFTRVFAQTFYLTVPQFGLLATTAAFALSLVTRSPVSYRLLAGVCGAGALAAIGFLAVQEFWVGALCPYCVGIDLSVIASAVFALMLAREVGRDPATATSMWRLQAGPSPITAAWGAAALLSIGLPYLWGAYPPIAPLPPEIAAAQRSGKVTLVEFTDFECPFCRGLHPFLEELRHKYDDRIALVRRMMPLHIHPGAEPAALAYLCTPDAEKDMMADALYDVDDAELTPDGVVRVGQKIGLDPTALRTCMNAPATRAALDDDVALFKRLGLRGLPMTYIGPRSVTGLQPEKIGKHVERELAGNRASLPLWGLAVALGAIYAAVSIVSLSVRRGRRSG